MEEGIEPEGLNPEQVDSLDLFYNRGTQIKAKAFKKFPKDLGLSISNG